MGRSRRMERGVRGVDGAIRWLIGGAIGCLAVLAWGCRSLPQGEAGEALDLRPLAARIADPERVRRIERAALTLLPVDAWPAARILRQRVRIEWGGGSESFDAVLQRRPGELSLLGLGPMNLVGFRLALLSAAPGTGGADRLEFENRSGRELPFTPTHILADVQRVFYPWLLDGPDCGACERRGTQGSVAVVEERVGGHLSLRRFELLEDPEAGSVQVRYAEWQGDPAWPGRVEIENGWFGYRIAIETLESLEAVEPAPAR